jgi:hypothetical protein
LLAIIAAKRSKMSEHAFGRMLGDIYGNAGAAGIYKLITTPGGAMDGLITVAATPQAAAAEIAEEETSRKMKERMGDLTNTAIMEEWQKGDKFFYQKQIRELGAEKQKTLEIEYPFYQWFRELVTPEFKEKEDAAFIRWYENLSPEEKRRILSKTKTPIHFGPVPLVTPTSRRYFQFKNYYDSLNPQQQYEGMAEPSVVSANFNSIDNLGPAQQSGRITGSPTIHYHTEYHNDMIYHPVAGTAADRDIGPRVDRDFK